MASPPPPDLPPGFSFTPGDAELLDVYLRRKIAREPLPAATARFVHDADVYAAEPEGLVSGLLPASEVSTGDGGESKRWYVFGCVRAKSIRDRRRCRAVAGGEGTWHSEKARRDVVDGEGRRVGYRQSFTYETKNGDKPGWLMVEFGVDQDRDGESRRGEPVPVLCKIYQTPRPSQSASKSSSSRSQRKRKKAAEERSDPASSSRARRRLLLPPSPPAPNPLTMGATSEFLMPVEPHPEADIESRGEASFLDDSFFTADGSALRCYGTTLPSDGDGWSISPWAPIAERSGSWTGGHATTAAPCLSGMEFLANFSMPVEPHPEPEESQSQGETPTTPGYGFFSPDHARPALTCYGSSTTLLRPGADWAAPPSPPSPCAELSGSWTGGHAAASCTSGMDMDFLAGLPAFAGFGQDASIYWCGEPSAAPGSSAASAPLCRGVEWSSVMQLPLHG